ncbi:hypothetical protein V6R21_12385 [Limibacter armeniacum]|uniref:hypothetical protein n=1 Tax=Limibacter armeniacum TaxID=466084 RepID=UPI002FE545B4
MNLFNYSPIQLSEMNVKDMCTLLQALSSEHTTSSSKLCRLDFHCVQTNQKISLSPCIKRIEKIYNDQTVIACNAFHLGYNKIAGLLMFNSAITMGTPYLGAILKSEQASTMIEMRLEHTQNNDDILICSTFTTAPDTKELHKLIDLDDNKYQYGTAETSSMVEYITFFRLYQKASRIIKGKSI